LIFTFFECIISVKEFTGCDAGKKTRSFVGILCAEWAARRAPSLRKILRKVGRGHAPNAHL